MHWERQETKSLCTEESMNPKGGEAHYQGISSISHIKIPIFLNFGTPKMINFPFGTNGKLIILGVPILERIVVI